VQGVEAGCACGGEETAVIDGFFNRPLLRKGQGPQQRLPTRSTISLRFFVRRSVSEADRTETQPQFVRESLQGGAAAVTGALRGQGRPCA
jgi:hypothetical protein